MIIQCKECGTKYRFDKSQIEGEGIWVRCSRCEAVFFQENPLAEIASLIESMETGGEPPGEINEEQAEDIDRMFSEAETKDDGQEPEQEETSEAADEIIDDRGAGGEPPGEINEEQAEDIDRMFSEAETKDDEQEPKQEETSETADEIIDDAGESGREEIRRPSTSGRKIALFLLIILISGGIYLWFSPHTRDVVSTEVLSRVEKIFGIKSNNVPDTGLYELEVSLTNVKERFVKNLIAGDIMVIEGFAVNNNECAVSNIKIRGKILDSSGNVLSEEESNCGNILTDDELKGLTEKEIRKELSNPYGREFSGIDIKPGKEVPFMLAFVMPAGEASEFVVELAGIEVAESK
ncbi:MAG: zinc-ribbon domain-containing protein [Deltaproteobacteria bacterium]|nr:zinc-ribbon domain-containing protein [Deltaproteobacteria bacterium]